MPNTRKKSKLRRKARHALIRLRLALRRLVKFVWRKEMILPALLGEALFWSPLITTALLALLIDPAFWATFAAIFGVWVIACPAIPIQLAFIAFFHFIFNILVRNKNRTIKGDKK